MSCAKRGELTHSVFATKAASDRGRSETISKVPDFWPKSQVRMFDFRTTPVAPARAILPVRHAVAESAAIRAKWTAQIDGYCGRPLGKRFCLGGERLAAFGHMSGLT